MSHGIEGRTVIITGAGSGIGAATALLLGAAGAKIVLNDIIDETEGVAEQIRTAGGKASFIRADLASESEIERLVATSIETFGRLDGAFNNAGVEQCATPLAELTLEQWDRAICVDLTAVFLCMKHQIRAMLKTGGGAIVNTASSLGAVALPRASEYVAAKHGVIGLTKAAALDYATDNIRVNAVLPGMVNTPMVMRISEDPNFAQFLQRLRDHHPIGRFGKPSEIGEAVKWLLSDDASFVTGASIPVDGGYLAN